jgi:CBS domain containing-hemolysin-like protein
MEMAFASSNKLRIELEIKNGSFSSRILHVFLKNSRIFGATLMIGFYVSVIFSVVCLYEFHHIYIEGFVQNVFLSFLILLGISMMFTSGISELVAHTLFTVNPNKLLKVFYFPLLFFYVLFYPFSQTLAALSEIPRLMRSSQQNNDIVSNVFMRNIGKLSSSESKQEVDFQNKQLQELKIFQNALVFSKVRIRDCMIPRTELESIDISGTIEDLKKKFIDSGYSKIIVYSDSIDNIEGFVSSKELFKHPVSIKDKLSPVTFVPETMPANKLLHEFMQHHRSIAVVVDEYGGTSGMVTLEDIMEKIFGDIEDEHDTDDLIGKQIRPNEFVFSSRLEIEYLNATFGLKIPESEDYSTLAGYILYHNNNLPKPNEIINIDKFTFKILKVSHTRIELVLLKIAVD